MKKRILLYLAVAFSSIVCAQNTFKLDIPTVLEGGGWIGNTNVTNFSLFEDAEYVIAPRMFEPELNGWIDSIKFYHNTYNDYNTDSYTLKVYENVHLELFNEQLHLYAYESCGDLIYSQDFKVTETGWNTIALTNPCHVPEGDFWVGIQMHGQGTIVTGDAGHSVEGMYYYTEMNNSVWYWSPTYFWLNYSDVLYSCGFAIYVSEEDAVQEAEVSNVNVYPNPVQGQLTIEGDGLLELQLMDKMGRMISSRPASGRTASMDLCHLPAGVYFVRVVTENGVAVRRVVNMN